MLVWYKFCLSDLFCCSVLWLPVATAEHDAGLHPNIYLSARYARKCHRLSRQGLETFWQQLFILAALSNSKYNILSVIKQLSDTELLCMYM